MAENSTNVFLDVLQSFDAGEFLTFHLFLFDVLTVVAAVLSQEFQALTTPEIGTICLPGCF